MNCKQLIHDESAFQRDTLEKRMQEYGFKNMGRMELFLWDLELFLQIQNRLGERVVLKGVQQHNFIFLKKHKELALI